MKVRRMATLFIPVLTMAGCGAMTERELEQRRYERANHEAEFIDYRARCYARGKRLWISARGKVGRDGVPGPGDHYYCG